MNIKHSVILAASLALSSTIIAPRLAGACGMPDDSVAERAKQERNAARALVTKHAMAVKRGDAKQLTKLWAAHSKNAVVEQMSRSNKRRISVTPMKQAIALWTRKPDPRMTWTIKSIDIKGSRATVSLAITWHRSVLDEQLTLMKRNGQWMLAGKRYRVIKAPAPSAKQAPSPYG